jgi:hypothetical protein
MSPGTEVANENKGHKYNQELNKSRKTLFIEKVLTPI